ncbi:hypothetical protein Tco_1395697 [Tanacetum coccineum]
MKVFNNMKRPTKGYSGQKVALFPSMLDVAAPSTSPSRITSSPSHSPEHSLSPTPSPSPEPTPAHTPTPTQPSPTQPKQGSKKASDEISTAGAKKGTTSEEVPIVSTAEVSLSTAGRTVTYTKRSAEKRSRQDKGKAILIEEEPKKKSKRKVELC